MYTCMHRYIYTYTYTYIYTWIYIYLHMHIYVHIHMYLYICICTYIYMYIHNSCMRAYATVQELLYHGSYCELILSLARTSCRLSFSPALLSLRRAGRPPAGRTVSSIIMAQKEFFKSMPTRSEQRQASSWPRKHS